MAAPITHIVLADKVFDLYFSHKDKPSFFAGTSFPDIRYLGVIDRDKTHNKQITLRQVIDEPSSCLAGVMFHSLVDKLRENFYQSNNLYSLVPESKYATQAVKIFEDILLYSKVIDWKNICGYFDHIYPEELDYELRPEDISLWHNMLKQYFKEKPTTTNIYGFINGISRNREEMSEEIINIINQINNNEPLIVKINEMYSTFENQLM